MPTVSEVTYEEKKNLLLKKFADSTPSGDPVIEADAVIDLSIDWVCLQRNLDRNDPTIRKSLRAEIKLRMRSFDPNNPELTYSAKLLRLLGGPNPGEMLTYAEDLDRARRKEEGQKQAARARTPRKPDGLNQILHRWVRNNLSISEPEVLTRLRNLEGHGVIIEIDKGDIDYYPTIGADAKTAKVSGLGTRLAKIRKQYR